MNLSGTQLKDTYGNLLTIGTTAGSPTTGTIENGDGQDITILTVAGKLVSTALQPSFDTGFYNVDGTISSYSASNYMYVNGLGGASGQGLRLNSNGSATNFIALENSNNSITLNTNSNPAITIDSSQNVGIGNQAPTVALDVTGDIALSNDLYVSNGNFIKLQRNSGGLYLDVLGTPSGTDDVRLLTSGAFDLVNGSLTSMLKVDSSGNVGIGETNPDRELDLKNSADNCVMSITSSASHLSGLVLGDTDDDDRGGILYNNTSDYLYFLSNAQERLRIDSSGTTTITATSGSSLQNATLQLKTTNGSNNAGLMFINTGNTSSFNDIAGIASFVESGDAKGNLRFWTRNSDGDNSDVGERMRIDSNGDTTHIASYSSSTTPFRVGYGTYASFTPTFLIDDSGNVGINKTSPVRTLHVDGGSISADTPTLRISSTDSSGTNKFGIEFFSNSGSDVRGKLLADNNGKVYLDDNGGGGVILQGNGGTGGVLIGTQGNPNGTTYYGSAFIDGGSGLRQLFQATSTTSTVSVQRFYNPNGNVGSIQLGGSATSFVTSSDYRLKENVVPMEGALDRVAQLKPSRFNFIADADTTVDGFLAHEVADVVPEAISGEKDAVDEKGNPIYQGIDQSKLVPLLVGAIQELRAEIEQLKNQ